MRPIPTTNWTRRATLGGLAAGVFAGGARVGGVSVAAPAPEVSTIRIAHFENDPVLCWAPQYLAEELLYAEGFENVELVPIPPDMNNADLLATDKADLSLPLAYDAALAIDKGVPLKILGGLHVGCVEVFANDRVPGLGDLKGARLLIEHKNFDAYRFLSTVIAWVGLDPARDVEWVSEPDRFKWADMFARGEVDVMRAFTPVNYEVREMGLGHVILNTTLDRPWRNFYCCMIAARSEFTRRYPVAAKRALRAFAKAQELCANSKTETARRLVEMGATRRRDFAESALADIPYGAWRDFDPAATMRFFALQMYEVGMIGTTPNQIVERGTDFRLLDELRREMKT